MSLDASLKLFSLRNKIHTHTHTHTHTYIHMHTQTYTHTKTYTLTHRYIHTQLHVCTHIHTNTLTHAQTHTLTHTHKHTHTCARARTHTLHLSLFEAKHVARLANLAFLVKSLGHTLSNSCLDLEIGNVSCNDLALKPNTAKNDVAYVFIKQS